MASAITTGNKIMNVRDIRASSCELAQKFGFQIPDHLPLLDADLESRKEIEVIVRALVVSVIVATSYGLKRDVALSWLEQESLTKHLSSREKDFLKGLDENRQQFQSQVETLCAFAWTLGLLPDLDFSKDCPNHLVSLYPDFKKLESADKFREKANLRSTLEIAKACDAAYCLQWGLNQAVVDGIKPKRRLSPVVVAERRRALEWILSKEDWDDITLDT